MPDRRGLGMLRLLLLLFLVGCTTTLTQEQQAFKETCVQHGDLWMEMSEMKNGFVVGKPCYGCMPDEKNHICTQEEYLTFK